MDFGCCLHDLAPKTHVFPMNVTDVQCAHVGPVRTDVGAPSSLSLIFFVTRNRVDAAWKTSRTLQTSVQQNPAPRRALVPPG